MVLHFYHFIPNCARPFIIYRQLLTLSKGNRKTREGKSNPDRNEQFQHISDTAVSFLSSDDPIISVEAKKKELDPFHLI